MNVTATNSRVRIQLPIILLLTGFVACYGGLLWWIKEADKNFKARESWPTAEAQIVDYRSLRNDISPGTGKFMIIYTGELKIRYRVGQNVYEQWHNIGYFSKEESDVSAKLEHERISGHYAVHYDPKNPAKGYPYKVQR